MFETDLNIIMEVKRKIENFNNRFGKSQTYLDIFDIGGIYYMDFVLPNLSLN